MPPNPFDRKSRAGRQAESEKSTVAKPTKRPQRGRYISDPILARRRRMLEIAKAMIAEGGSEGFTIRELGRRAKVSVTTIYAAYGDKNGLIAAAIDDYYQQLPLSRAPLQTSLAGVLSALDRAQDAVLANKPYARQYTYLYFSNTADPVVHKTIRDTANNAGRYLPWLQKVMRDGDLIAGFTTDYITTLIANHGLVALHDWAQDRLTDEELPRATKLSFLIIARAVTRGPTHARVEAELKKLLRASQVDRTVE